MNKLLTKITNPLTAIFFDAGNTLVSIDYHFIKEVIGSFGFDISVKQLREAEYNSREFINQLAAVTSQCTDDMRWRVYFKKILTLCGVTDDSITDKILLKLYERHIEINLWNQLENGAVETLEYVRNCNMKIGMISNSDGRIIELLTDLKIIHYFDTIVDSGKVGIEKPDKRIFEIGLKNLGVAARESAYIGDLYEVDIVGAKRVGMLPILIDPLAINDYPDCIIIRKIIDLITVISEGTY